MLHGMCSITAVVDFTTLRQVTSRSLKPNAVIPAEAGIQPVHEESAGKRRRCKLAHYPPFQIKMNW